MTKYTHGGEPLSEEEINEYRQMWLAQLRDPESQKEKFKLENVDNPKQRCCLGHACYALGVEMTIIDDDREESGRSVFYDTCQGDLPVSVCEKLDINSAGALIKSITINGVVGCKNLININDSTDLSPQEIADVIEDQFKNNNFQPWFSKEMVYAHNA